jgi:hypothetical protein
MPVLDTGIFQHTQKKMAASNAAMMKRLNEID